MPEQTKQQKKDQEPDLENQARRDRGSQGQEEARQGNRGGQQNMKEGQSKQNESKGQKDQGFESAGRGVRAKSGMEENQPEKALDSKHEEALSSEDSESEDEESPSNMRNTDSRTKKGNREIEETDAA